MQWNLYKATTKFCSLSRQVVFHDKENKHDFVKTVPGKLCILCVFSKTSLVSLYRFHCICMPYWISLTHWGRMMHIWISKLTTIGSDNGLLTRWRPAIISPNAIILLIRPLETKFSETLIEIHIFSFKKVHLKMSPVKWQPFHFGLNVLTCYIITNCEMNIAGAWLPQKFTSLCFDMISGAEVRIFWID